MSLGETLTFDDFRGLNKDPTYTVRQLDSRHLLRVPDLSSERWTPERNSIGILHIGQGEVSAQLTGGELSVENTAVRTRRIGVAQGMMGYLFAVAIPNGAIHMSGVASSRGIIGMYAKMVGTDNLKLGETSAPANDFSTVMEALPSYPVNDSYCTYKFDLSSLEASYIAALPPHVMSDPLIIPRAPNH